MLLGCYPVLPERPRRGPPRVSRARQGRCTFCIMVAGQRRCPRMTITGHCKSHSSPARLRPRDRQGRSGSQAHQARCSRGAACNSISARSISMAWSHNRVTSRANASARLGSTVIHCAYAASRAAAISPERADVLEAGDAGGLGSCLPKERLASLCLIPAEFIAGRPESHRDLLFVHEEAPRLDLPGRLRAPVTSGK